MKIRCVAIDDEPWALELIKQYVGQFAELELEGTFDDAIEGATYLAENSVDLLFVDINMPDLTGLELVARLTEPPMVIFTTAHKKFALEGFDLNALDYLLKPIDFERFQRAVRKAIDYYHYKNATPRAEPTALYIRSEYRLVKVELDDILYVEGLSDYIKIHLQSSPRPVLTLMTMKGILEQLPTTRFSRIHRSYIVAHDKVVAIQNKKVELPEGTLLPISHSFQEFIGQWGNR
jgi:two-component system, LytTR family, response regulator